MWITDGADCGAHPVADSCGRTGPRTPVLTGYHVEEREFCKPQLYHPQRETGVRILVGGLIMLSLAGPVVADNVSPYGGQINTEIRGLSKQEVSDLREGRGMGRARAAELNGYPGPRHVLDAAQAGQLALTPEQARTAQQLFDGMAREARRVGDQILREEQGLEGEFRAGRISGTDLRARTSRIAALEGKLRAVHLRAHIVMRAALSESEIQQYNVLRGYGPPAEQQHQHPRH